MFFLCIYRCFDVRHEPSELNKNKILDKFNYKINLLIKQYISGKDRNLRRGIAGIVKRNACVN